MSEFKKYKEVQQFNYINRDTSKKCRDCGGELHPQWYGYNCQSCGQMYNTKLEYVTDRDLI